MPSKYTHIFDLCFSVPTDKADWEDVTADELRLGIIKRLSSIHLTEYEEACGYVDTTEEDDEVSCVNV